MELSHLPHQRVGPVRARISPRSAHGLFIPERDHCEWPKKQKAPDRPDSDPFLVPGLSLRMRVKMSQYSS